MDIELGKHGWELAVPGSGGMFVCTVGGSVAYNSVPHGMGEYGMTGDWVIALEVVLPNGEIIYTGSAANRAAGGLAMERYANGPDLAGLFIGSCGVYGIITRVSYRIRRKPEAERFAFYGFATLDAAVDAAHGIQRQGRGDPPGGPVRRPQAGRGGGRGLPARHYPRHPGGGRGAADGRARICAAFNGVRLDPVATERYWVNHMYSWLRNTAPENYYSDRPYTCPEATAFMPTQRVKDAIRYLKSYEVENAAEFARYGIRIKAYDVYFTGTRPSCGLTRSIQSWTRKPGSTVSRCAPTTPNTCRAGTARPAASWRHWPAHHAENRRRLRSDEGVEAPAGPKGILNPGVLMLDEYEPAAGREPAQWERGERP